jgi:hypothetical protein
MQSIFINKCFLFRVGSVCSVKRFTTGCKRFADDEEIKTEVQKWPRQQSKYFYAVGFDVLIKRWDKCNVTDLLKAFLGNGSVNTFQCAIMEDGPLWTNDITRC